MKVEFKDRFGNPVKFEAREKETRFEVLPGERFMTALVRTYYPREYRRIYKGRVTK